MCAINGVLGKVENAKTLVEKMNGATRHRGPDGSGIFSEPGITLGFNRLAIIDLSERAMQPMTDATGRYTIVFNGEIYNYRELKYELSEYPFKSESDTEVILAAYSRWGDAAFSKLNGMFALALWDKVAERLILARDPVGVKPLYYHFDGTRLVFSSEIKAILETGVPRILDRDAFGHYLRLMYTPAPMTMFKDIRKLLPGCTLTVKDDSLLVEPFRGGWPATPRARSYQEAKELTRNTVNAAVTRQLVSDRPVGMYLSGGIDSSVILSSASAVHPKIDTFSVGFDLTEGEEHEKFNADAELARKTAAHFGATHHEFRLSSDDALSLFAETVRHLDEPIGNATALSQVFLARQVKPVATVVLTGDGGDELFGGYERYRLSRGAEIMACFIPRFVARDMFGFENTHVSGVDRFAQLMFQKSWDIERVVDSSCTLPDTRAFFANEFTGTGSVVDALMCADEKYWLTDEALTRSDKASMAGSVETRVPLLDLEIRALAHSLPPSYKVTTSLTKRILKDAFKDVLPKDVLRAPKRGWFSPGAKWLRRDDFMSYANVVFTPEYAPGVAPLLNFNGIRSMWEDHRTKRAYHYTLLFALLVFLEWAREYKVSL